jgi:phosphate starvation-inducible protein PhoH
MGMFYRCLGYIYLLSTVCYSKKGLSLKKMKPSLFNINPKSENQKLYIEQLRNDDVNIVVGVGPAGCGKTLLACYTAINSLMVGKVDKIIITRPLVSSDEELGFLPGSLSQKMDPWVRPIFDIMSEMYTPLQLRSMLDDGIIEISPLAYMRGRTFKRSFIIADEMQNSTPNQMLMILTRIGEGSKMVVTGDLMQSDIKIQLNGLNDFIQKYKKDDNSSQLIKVIELSSQDVQRSNVVSKILDIYNQMPSIPQYNNISITKVTIPLKSGSSNNSDATMKPFKNWSSKNSDAAMIPFNNWSSKNSDAAMIPFNNWSSRNSDASI